MCYLGYCCLELLLWLTVRRLPLFFLGWKEVFSTLGRTASVCGFLLALFSSTCLRGKFLTGLCACLLHGQLALVVHPTDYAESDDKTDDDQRGLHGRKPSSIASSAAAISRPIKIGQATKRTKPTIRYKIVSITPPGEKFRKQCTELLSARCSVCSCFC